MELSNITKVCLTANGIDANTAVSISESIISDVAENFGGTAIYLKNGTQQQHADKHSQIVADFTGANHSELMKKYHISKAWLVKLLKRSEAQKQTS